MPHLTYPGGYSAFFTDLHLDFPRWLRLVALVPLVPASPRGMSYEELCLLLLRAFPSCNSSNVLAVSVERIKSAVSEMLIREPYFVCISADSKSPLPTSCWAYEPSLDNEPPRISFAFHILRCANTSPGWSVSDFFARIISAAPQPATSNPTKPFWYLAPPSSEGHTQIVPTKTMSAARVPVSSLAGASVSPVLSGPSSGKAKSQRISQTEPLLLPSLVPADALSNHHRRRGPSRPLDGTQARHNFVPQCTLTPPDSAALRASESWIQTEAQGKNAPLAGRSLGPGPPRSSAPSGSRPLRKVDPPGALGPSLSLSRNVGLGLQDRSRIRSAVPDCGRTKERSEGHPTSLGKRKLEERSPSVVPAYERGVPRGSHAKSGNLKRRELPSFKRIRCPATPVPLTTINTPATPTPHTTTPTNPPQQTPSCHLNASDQGGSNDGATRADSHSISDALKSYPPPPLPDGSGSLLTPSSSIPRSDSKYDQPTTGEVRPALVVYKVATGPNSTESKDIVRVSYGENNGTDFTKVLGRLGTKVHGALSLPETCGDAKKDSLSEFLRKAARPNSSSTRRYCYTKYTAGSQDTDTSTAVQLPPAERTEGDMIWNFGVDPETCRQRMNAERARIRIGGLTSVRMIPKSALGDGSAHPKVSNT
ncbi:hypothetical protein BC834DRAFT_870546 [Gloeopeniophorella convolvens]|nr:hypothetical protein BC834DRAFT_870546 [Gloeopeniophorella convolvens]